MTSEAGLREREGDQALPTPGHEDVAERVMRNIRDAGLSRGGAEAVAERIAADLEARVALGVTRYGTRLQTHNGRDCLRDQYEELLDAANYGKQHVLEFPSGRAQHIYWRTIGLLFDLKELMEARET